MPSKKKQANSKPSDLEIIKVKVKYSDDNIVVIRATKSMKYEEFINILSNKINIVSLDGCRVKARDLIIYQIRNDKEFVLTNMNDILTSQNRFFLTKQKKNLSDLFNFSRYGDIGYLNRIVNRYSPNFDAKTLEMWTKSVKCFIDGYLYRCVKASENNHNITSYYLSLFYILYTEYNSNKIYTDILRTIKTVSDSKNIITKYTIYLCDNYYSESLMGIGKDKKMDDNLLHSLCFISVYQTSINTKWDGNAIKNIIMKLTPLKSFLSEELNTYYRVINNYLIFYDSDIDLIEKLPIIPTYEEIHCSEDLILSMLKENKLKGYESVREYFITHYLLLRADILLPLQQTINVFIIIIYCE